MGIGNSLEAFLFYHFLRENKDGLNNPDDIPGYQFFIKYVDDKGGHLLIDDEYNVTGIIDWQFERVVPAADAFGPSYVTVEMILDGRRCKFCSRSQQEDGND